MNNLSRACRFACPVHDIASTLCYRLLSRCYRRFLQASLHVCSFSFTLIVPSVAIGNNNRVCGGPAPVESVTRECRALQFREYKNNPHYTK